MKTTYLSEFLKYAQGGIAYLPIGTIEWHGHHLPLETDLMVADKVTELVSQEIPGYILPPLYLATDKEDTKNGEILRGMDRHLGKFLAGNIYYIVPDLLYEVLKSLVENLTKNGFQKIFIITGHAGSKHIEVLEKIDKDNKEVFFVNPFKDSDIEVHHADENETSLLWACCPEEKEKGLKVEILEDDDYVTFVGHNPLEKASVEMGEKLLKKMVGNSLKQVKENI